MGDVDRLRALMDEGGDSDGDAEIRGLKARVVLHHMFQFTGLADVDGTLIEANQTALDAGGIERRDVIGRPVWEAHWFTVSADVQRRTREAIAHAVEQRELVRYDEEVYATAHGTATIPIDFSARPILGSDGTVAFLVLEGRDIAEKEHAKRLRNQLFANVSHELRTPLTLILGRAGALLDDGLDAAAREPVSRIADNARVLLGKVNDLLHIAALEAGGITVAARPIDVRELVRGVVNDLTPLTTARDIDVRLEAPDPVPAVTDPDHLETIVVNLVVNACKVVEDGGLVVVAVAVRDSRLVLEVRDDGPGVRVEERHRVFDAFHQLEHTTSRRVQGTGLGLAIVRNLVELHGGEIAVRDAPEGGACFRITLPHVPVPTDDVATQPHGLGRAAADQAAASTAARRLSTETPLPDAAAAAPPDDGADRVLLVEDNVDLVRFLTEQLAGRYHLTSASDGQEAIELLGSGDVAPDLVVTDLMMPRLGGDELIARLQDDEELARIPVLVLTAREDQQMRDQLLADGASDYLVKPFSVPELRARIENLLGPVRLTRELTEMNAQLQRYARQLSHDVKTPLTSLVGLAETIRDHLGDLEADSLARMLDRIVANGHRMARLVDDLLVEVTGETEGQVVAVGDVLEEVRALLADELAAHDVRVVVAGRLPEVAAGAGAVRTVLTNLLANAINYRAAERPLVVEVSATRRGRWQEISITDNGLGVAPEDRERIFAPGHRGSDPEKQQRHGSGIGLFTSRQLLARYGGDLWNVASEPPGTEFRFTLPAADARDGDGRPPAGTRRFS